MFMRLEHCSTTDSQTERGTCGLSRLRSRSASSVSPTISRSRPRPTGRQRSTCTWISPDDPQHEQQINNALGRLTWEFDHRPYSCLPDQLIALGKAFDPQIKDDGAALSMGALQFKVDFTAFRPLGDLALEQETQKATPETDQVTIRRQVGDGL